MEKTRIIILMIFMFFACSKNSRVELELERMDVQPDVLKLNGFYSAISTDEQQVLFILNSNGVVFGGITFEGVEKDSIVEFLNDDQRLKGSQNIVYFWGLFKYQDDAIIIEKWITSDAWKYQKSRIEGSVLNDTTFTLFYSDEYMRFEFMEFSPKPDSTTRFIE